MEYMCIHHWQRMEYMCIHHWQCMEYRSIHHYYRYQRKYFDEDSILSNLSPGLKEARTQHLHVPMTTLTQAQLHLYCFHHSVCLILYRR